MSKREGNSQTGNSLFPVCELLTGNSQFYVCELLKLIDFIFIKKDFFISSALLLSLLLQTLLSRRQLETVEDREGESAIIAFGDS